MNDTTEEPSIGKERLAVLRLVRDGLQTKEDHLNLCRKHIYSRLMLLFPLLASSDNHIGHAILDIFDRAIGLPFASRYLLQRCMIIEWIGTMSHISAEERGSRSDQGFASSGAEEDNKMEPAYCLQTAPPQMLPRMVSLLRKATQSAYLLSSEIGLSLWRSIHCVLTGYLVNIRELRAVKDAGFLSSIPREYLRQLLLCLWDYCTCAFANHSASDVLLFHEDHITELADVFAETGPLPDRCELVLSTLLLLSFPLNSSSATATSSNRGIKRMLRSFKSVFLSQHGTGLLAFIPLKKKYFRQSSSENKLSSHYFNAVHLLAQDNIEIDDNKSVDVDRITTAAWGILASTNFEVSVLPTSFGARFALALMYSYLSRQSLADVAWEDCLFAARIACISNIFMTSDPDCTRLLKTRLANRIISIVQSDSLNTVEMVMLAPLKLLLRNRSQFCNTMSNVSNSISLLLADFMDAVDACVCLSESSYSESSKPASAAEGFLRAALSLLMTMHSRYEAKQSSLHEDDSHFSQALSALSSNIRNLLLKEEVVDLRLTDPSTDSLCQVADTISGQDDGYFEVPARPSIFFTAFDTIDVSNDEKNNVTDEQSATDEELASRKKMVRWREVQWGPLHTKWRRVLF